MRTFALYAIAAVAEIVGCFAFWAVLRLDKPASWLLPGIAALVLFAYALTMAESTAAGRAFAAYGGVYVAASLFWLWLVERVTPDRWDVLGGGVCLAGAAIVLMGPR